MNINELAIDNWVQHERWHHKIVSIDKRKGANMVMIELNREDKFTQNVLSAHINPIPLTNDLLSKLGFVKTDNKMHTDGIEMVLKIDDFTSLRSCANNDGATNVCIQCGPNGKGYYASKWVSKLHLLQNLYFFSFNKKLETFMLYSQA